MRKQYAAEWALDQVEQQIREELLPDPPGSEALEWSLDSPERLSVFVEATTATYDAGTAAQLDLAAWIGPRGEPLARRQIGRYA